ncbi:MAG: hypothetical protein OEX83_04075, partial [Gammaproteobacteria bacterium]|nr:hypothetical protein [Gammaproteobacteria bacterium]
RQEIINEVKHEKASDVFYELADKLADLSYENQSSLEVPAAETGLKIKETEFFAVGKGQGIAANPKFGNKAFEEEVLVQRTNSDPVEVMPGNLVVLRVKDHKPAEIKPLNDVKALIVTKLKAQIASTHAKILADKIKQRLIAGEAGNKIAAELKLKWLNKASVARNESSLNPDVVKKAFGLGRPEGKSLIDTVELGNGDFAVVVVSNVKDGDTVAVTEDEKLNLARTIIRARSMDTYNAYMKGLRNESKIVIRETEL